MTRRMTFAFRVFGRSRTNFTSHGDIGFPSSRATRPLSSSRNEFNFEDENEDEDDFKTQKQTSASPFNSSGTPMAAASLTAGCATSTDSTSAGPMRFPATLIVSS